MEITIPSTSTSSDGKVYYQVQIKAPLRTLTVAKRYSEFDELVKKLCYDVGIDTADFPYPLPPKTGLFFKNSSTVQERQARLAQFLNCLAKDNDFQNHPLVHKFLNLPANFKFPKPTRQSGSGDGIHISDSDNIDSVKWLELLRHYRYTVNELAKNYDGSIHQKISVRNTINNSIAPGVGQLDSRLVQLLDSKEVDASELNRRRLLVQEVRSDLEDLQTQVSTAKSDKTRLMGQSKRVLGAPRETNETVALDNKGLFQQQQQIHRSQDQEVEQLRKIIARQRQLGETINTEVQEQNQLLDMFADEVDHSNDKVKNARTKARGIL